MSWSFRPFWKFGGLFCRESLVWDLQKSNLHCQKITTQCHIKYLNSNSMTERENQPSLIHNQTIQHQSPPASRLRAAAPLRTSPHIYCISSIQKGPHGQEPCGSGLHSMSYYHTIYLCLLLSQTWRQSPECRRIPSIQASKTWVKLKRHEWKRPKGFTIRVLFKQTNKQKKVRWFILFHPRPSRTNFPLPSRPGTVLRH